MMHGIVETRWVAAISSGDEEPELPQIEARPEVKAEIESSQEWRRLVDSRLDELEAQMSRILEARARVMIQEREGDVADQ